MSDECAETREDPPTAAADGPWARPAAGDAKPRELRELLDRLMAKFAPRCEEFPR